jgi:hypothetical protein
LKRVPRPLRSRVALGSKRWSNWARPRAVKRLSRLMPEPSSRWMESARPLAARERLGDLARDPLRGWVCRHTKRHQKSSSVSYDNKTIENLERDRRQDKKVDRRDTVGMVAEKRPPALRRWPPAAAHIPSDRRLSDIEAELEQFTMNAWCAPERVRAAHLANERAQLSRDLRSANTVARSPAPIRPKPSTVPENDRFRPDNRNRL